MNSKFPSVIRFKKIFIDLPHDNDGIIDIHIIHNENDETIYGLQMRLGEYSFSFRKNIEDKIRFIAGVHKIFKAEVNHINKQVAISDCEIASILLMDVSFTNDFMIVHLFNANLDIDCVIVIDSYEFKYFKR